MMNHEIKARIKLGSPPGFDPGSEHIAHVSVANLAPEPHSYTVRLTVATETGFFAGVYIAPGQTTSLDFGVRMPDSPGTYPVLVEVWDEVIGQKVGDFPFDPVAVTLFPPPSPEGEITDIRRLGAAQWGLCPDGLACQVPMWEVDWKFDQPHDGYWWIHVDCDAASAGKRGKWGRGWVEAKPGVNPPAGLASGSYCHMMMAFPELGCYALVDKGGTWTVSVELWKCSSDGYTYYPVHTFEKQITVDDWGQPFLGGWMGGEDYAYPCGTAFI